MPRIRRYTREKLLSLARDLAKTYGESLTLTAFRRETGLSQHLIFDLCGTWCELRTAIGLTPEAPRARNKLSSDAILEKLKTAVAQHGDNLSETRFCQLSGLSGTMISRRFGSWGQLRQLIGLPPRAKISCRYTDQQIFDDLHQVICRIHRCPTYPRYKRDGGLISAQTIRDRFGTWEDALEAYNRHIDRLMPNSTRTVYGEDGITEYRGDTVRHYPYENILDRIARAFPSSTKASPPATPSTSNGDARPAC